jgi:hypothetical protein
MALLKSNTIIYGTANVQSLLTVGSLLSTGNVVISSSANGITFGDGTRQITSGLSAKSTSVFTTGAVATYTAPTNTQWVKVTVVGPGGNGGAATGARATGGGGGAVSIKWLLMSEGQTLTYSVGNAAGSASTVSSGTLTITTISAGSGTNGTSTAYATSITAGGAGGAASGGDVNITGGQGGYSYGSGTTVTTNFGGKGGGKGGGNSKTEEEKFDALMRKKK